MSPCELCCALGGDFRLTAPTLPQFQAFGKGCRLARRRVEQPACARGFHFPLAGLRQDDDLRGTRRRDKSTLRCPLSPARVVGRKIGQPGAGPRGKERVSRRAISACPATCGAASLRKGAAAVTSNPLKRVVQNQPALAGFGVSDREFIHGAAASAGFGVSDREFIHGAAASAGFGISDREFIHGAAAEKLPNLAQARRVRSGCRGGRFRLARRRVEQPACARGGPSPPNSFGRSHIKPAQAGCAKPTCFSRFRCIRP